MTTPASWPWSDPDDDGQLVPDVRVGEWSMPWNAKADAKRLGPGIPKSDFWASAKEWIDQVGRVYTAQGFEFDYVGVIVGQRDQSHDRVVRRGVTEAEFTRYVESTYRVLLTRGLRGCYVYSKDAPTRDVVIVGRSGLLMETDCPEQPNSPNGTGRRDE